ncbi:MAG: hypothetical protein ACRD0G_08170 [Acidimicrobiales bacterium]
MATTAATPAGADTLRKGEKVVAAVDFPGIPAGTAGKVIFVEGFEWIRYWVRFENGATKGSIHRRKLARPDEWTSLLERRERGEDAEEQATAEANGDEGGAAEEASGEGIVHNGVLVPAHLLERSKKRREVLGK